MFPVIIVAVLAAPVVAAVAAVGVAVRHSEREYTTTTDIRDWCRSRGFVFHPQWHSMATALHTSLPHVSQVWAGFHGESSEGAHVFGATCTWEVNHGRSSTSHHRDLRGVRLDLLDIPTLVVRRRRRAVVMAPQLFGGRVLDVEYAGFSRRWKVSCSSSRLAHDLLHPRVLEALMQAPRWVDAVWFDADCVVLSGRGGTPERADQALGLLARLASLIPDFAAEELEQGSIGALYGGLGRRSTSGISDALPW